MNYEGNLLTNSTNINNNTKPYYNIRNTFINLNMHPNYDLEIKDNIIRNPAAHVAGFFV